MNWHHIYDVDGTAFLLVVVAAGFFLGAYLAAQRENRRLRVQRDEYKRWRDEVAHLNFGLLTERERGWLGQCPQCSTPLAYIPRCARDGLPDAREGSHAVDDGGRVHHRCVVGHHARRCSAIAAAAANIPEASMIALVLVALIVAFAVSTWAALEAIRDNQELRRRLDAIEAAKNSKASGGVG